MTPATLAAKLLSTAALGLVVGRVVHAIAVTPSRVQTSTGLRGLKRRRAIADSLLWARAEPFVRWLGVRVRGLLTDDLHAAIERKIVLAGDYGGLVAEELVALSLLVGGFSFVVGSIVAATSGAGDLVAILFTAIGPLLPWIQLSDAARTRLTSINRNMPYFVDLLALSVGAGLDFPGSIRRMVEKASDPTEPFVEELGLLLQSLQLGRTRRAALEELAIRAPVEAVREFTSTLIQADVQGTPIGSALGALASTARLKRSIDAEEKAARAGVLMLGPLGLMFLALLALIIGPVILSMKEIFS